MNVADYIVSKLVASGIRDVFVLPGGGSMYLVDALARCPAIRSVAMLHEQGAAIAAEAYAQARDGLGVAVVTTGPGGTNAMTGVASAWLDSVPLLVISGQVKTTDLAGDSGLRQRGFQEINVVEMVRPITKFAMTVLTPQSACEKIQIALDETRSKRPGPVWLDIPLNVQSATVPQQLPTKVFAQDSEPASFDVKQLIHDLRIAQRPLVLLGNGVRLSGAIPEVNALMNVLQVPYQVSWKALDLIPFDHKLFAGRPGGIATRYANFAQQSADLFIAIGARMDYGQTAYNPNGVAPRAKRYFVDIDARELQKLISINTETIAEDAKKFLQIVLGALGNETIRAPERWTQRILEWKERYSLSSEGVFNEYLGTYDVVEILSNHMSAEDVLVPGSSGACSEVTMQAFKNKIGQRVLNSQGLGAMGFGVPAAIGVAIAFSDRDVYSVDGDGGFVMNIQELEVAKRLELPICWIVLDNGGYGSIVSTQNSYFSGRKLASDTESGLTLPSIVDVAKAFGLRSELVSTKAQLEVALSSFRSTRMPTVIVAKVSSQHRTIPRVASRTVNGSISSDPMEDMSPKLPEEVLRSEIFFD